MLFTLHDTQVVKETFIKSSSHSTFLVELDPPYKPEMPDLDPSDAKLVSFVSIIVCLENVKIKINNRK